MSASKVWPLSTVENSARFGSDSESPSGPSTRYSHRDKALTFLLSILGFAFGIPLRIGLRRSAMLVCSCVVAVVTFGCAVMMLYTMRPKTFSVTDPMAIMFALNFAGILLYVTVVGLTLLKSKRNGCLEAYYRQLDQSVAVLQSHQIPVKTKMDWFQVLILLYAIAAILAVLVLLLLDSLVWKSLPLLRTLPNLYPVLLIPINFAVTIGMSGFMVVPAYLMNTCHMIQHLFKQYNKCIQHQASASPHSLLGNLATLRDVYVQLCDVVELSDRCWSSIIGVQLSCLLLVILLVLYYLAVSVAAHEPFSNDDWLMGLTLLVFIISLLMLIWWAHLLHSEASRTHDILLSLRGSDLALSDSVAQLHLFTSRTGTSVGYTAAGFFLINKQLILSLVGIVLTYFIAMLQFQTTQPGDITTSNDDGVTSNISSINVTDLTSP